MYNGSHVKPRKMYSGAHVKPRKKSGGRRPLLLLVSLVLILALAVGGTVAWLNSSSGPVTNTMTPGKVPITINETFDGAKKSGVSVTNNGNIDAYIRVAIVANAVDKNGNIIAGKAPDYVSLVNTDYWQPLEDGYYYYKGAVAPGNTTKPLFTDDVTVTDGELNILAESIQVLGGINGQTASVYAWGHSFDGTNWHKEVRT